MKNGGYIIVSVADTNIYEKVNSALINGKPILFYDDTETAYYIDTMSKDGDGNIILTKGGKTFTITDVNSVMATGEVQNHLYEYTIDFDFTSDEDEYTNRFFGKLLTNKFIDTTINDETLTLLADEITNKKGIVISGLVNVNGNDLSSGFLTEFDFDDNTITIYIRTNENSGDEFELAISNYTNLVIARTQIF